MSPLLVLAGGFGTRLRSAVADVPKPLAPVAGQPYLRYLVEHWSEQGVDDFVFLLHHEAAMFGDFLDSVRVARFAGCSVRTVIEPRPLGTGGAIANAIQQLRLAGPFLVANADTWLGGGVAEILSAAPPAIAVVKVENTERYGSIQVEEGKVAEFREKSSSNGTGLINAGLYHLESDEFADWDGSPFSLERRIFPELASASRLSSVVLDTEFIDIGVPEDYFRFCRWIESERVERL